MKSPSAGIAIVILELGDRDPSEVPPQIRLHAKNMTMLGKEETWPISRCATTSRLPRVAV
jgi:hypothetical protein